MKRTLLIIIVILLSFWHMSAWEAPVNLSNSNRASLYPRMAVDGQGVIHVVWTEFESSTVANIYYRRHDRNGWSERENLSNSNCPSREASIAVDRAGNVYVVWVNNMGCPAGLRGLSLLTIHADGGRSLDQLPFTMNSSVDELKVPYIASDDDGNLSVVSYTGHRRVWGRNRDHGNWTDWRVINTPGVFSASESSYVTYGRDGKFYAVWPEYMPGRDLHYSIYWTSREVGRDWELPRTTRHDGIPLDNAQAHPKIEVDEKGDMHLVWMDHPDNILDIFYQRWDNRTRAWVDRSYASRRGGYSTLPTIALTRSGVRYVAYSLGPYGNLFNAQYNYAPPGGTFLSQPLNFFPQPIVNPYFTQIAAGGPDDKIFFIYEQGPQHAKDIFFTSLFPLNGEPGPDPDLVQVEPPVGVRSLYHTVNYTTRNLRVEKIVDRNLFTVKHLNRVSWERNPELDRLNADIFKYRIYRRRHGVQDFVPIKEVNAGVFSYLDENQVGPEHDLEYRVRGVDNLGNESYKFNDISWLANPANDANKLVITNYRVYRRIRGSGDADFQLCHQAGADVFSWIDLDVEIRRGRIYDYAVAALAEDGRESEKTPAAVEEIVAGPGTVPTAEKK